MGERTPPRRGRRRAGTTIARSRSTSGKRPTAGVDPGQRPSARPAIASSATMTRSWPAGPMPRARSGCSSPTTRGAGPPTVTAGRDRGGTASRRVSASRWLPAGPGACASSSMTPLASSRSYGRAARFQAGGSAAPTGRRPGATTRAGSSPGARSPCRSRTRRRPRVPAAG